MQAQSDSVEAIVKAGAEKGRERVLSLSPSPPLPSLSASLPLFPPIVYMVIILYPSLFSPFFLFLLFTKLKRKLKLIENKHVLTFQFNFLVFNFAHCKNLTFLRVFE